ncbi:MAG: hypothetical protein ACE5JO_02705 [Candidatus Binatia bacterium]
MGCLEQVSQKWQPLGHPGYLLAGTVLLANFIVLTRGKIRRACRPEEAR